MARLKVQSFTNLDAARNHFLGQVDAAAAALMADRSRPAHAAKAAEAARYPEAPHPYLTAEARATGQSMADIAAAVLAAKDQCDAANAEIEAARIAAKRAIRAAATAAEMHRAAERWRS